jgi:glycosyltransferase A (GT-A) superfamily protein (DUF2064 family)
MTVIAVLALPPREGLVLPELPETSPLSSTAATDLYAAMLADTFRAVERSGADLLINYPEADQLPEAHRTDTDPVAELRALVADSVDDTDAVRFEPQVGSSFSARAGNTATHLLREEEAASVAIVRGTAPLLSRTLIDEAAMKLRTNEAVLGPTTEGRTYYAGFTEPIDFSEAFTGIELQRLADRAADADLETEFLPPSPIVETGDDLRTLVAQLRARVTAERVVPERTATFVHDHGLVVVDDDGPELVMK